MFVIETIEKYKLNEYRVVKYIDFVSETVIIVPAADTVAAEQSEQNGNIQQIQQSQEIVANSRNDGKSNDSPVHLNDANSGKPRDIHENDKNQRKNDDEQHLMSNKVYQRTTKPINETRQRRTSSKWGGSVNCRTVLWYVAFVGFMVNYMYRININIAIVEMVSNKKPTIISDDQTSECLSHPMLSKSPANTTNTVNVKSFILCF